MRKTLYIIMAVAILGTIAAMTVSKNIGKSISSSAASTTSTSSANTAPATTTTISNVAARSTPATTPTGTSSSTTTTANALKDGTFTGSDSANRYGDVQVSISIASGKITAIKFVKLTAEDNHSAQINSYAGPQLESQTLIAQNASIDGVSGASYTSQSYEESLQSALDQAKNA